MKNTKSLTCLFLVLLVSACTGQSSATFSSSIFDGSNNSDETTSESSSSSDETSSSSSSSSSSGTSATSSSSPSSSISSSSSSSSSQYEDDTVYYDGYYSSLVSWTDGEDLKNQLNAIIRNGYTPLSYTRTNQNYSTNINADHTKYDFEYLDVVYSEKDTFKTETNKGWQREHAWCASLMCGSTTGNAVKFKGRATDFHNLFAAGASGNQARTNKNYGTANKEDFYYKDNTTNNGQDGYSSDEHIFEPGNVDKGRLARAIFYMATMYKDAEVDTANNINMKGLTIVEERVDYIAGNDCAFAIGNLSTLLSWNASYDVDYLEMQHNIAVYSSTDNLDKVAQGNRNPYVDYPELVDYVYGSKKSIPGALKNVRAAATYLNCEGSATSHYAIKDAKREHDLGETISQDDYKVVAVKNNYSYEEVTTGITHSLTGHVFDANDGSNIEATIITPLNGLTYVIDLNPMGLCSSGVLSMDKTGINNKTPNVDQSVSYGGVGFSLNFSTTYSDVSTNGIFIQNDNQKGGFTFGSAGTNGNPPRDVTRLEIKTKQSYTINKAFIKATASNSTSSYRLTIKVGDVVLLDNELVAYNATNYQLFGDELLEAATGQVSFVFTGSNAIKLHSIAFNEIIV